jgi:LysM repeat protein
MIALRNRTYRTLRLGIVASLLVMPALAAAQQTVETPKTHTVKKGDTLWDLAAHYLGDAFRWPEIYRINTDVVEDPHWIYPGEILKLPGYLPTDLPGVAQPGRDSIIVAPPTAARLDSNDLRPVTRQPTIFGNRAAEQPARPVTAPTDTTGQQFGIDTTLKAAPTVRYGDLIRAPWVDRLKGPPVWGRIIGSAELPGIEPARQRGRFQISDQILIAPPTGSVAPEKELYLAYTNGPLLEEVGQVIIPTGVVEVTRPPVNGEAAIAKVVRMFGVVSERDRLMPYDSSGLGLTGMPSPVKNGAEGMIRWIANEPVLPSPTYFIVLSLTSGDVKAGDEVELFQARKKAQDEGEYATPEIKVGRAQVIKVTPYGSTALITRLDQPKVEAEKTKVRVVAKMQ